MTIQEILEAHRIAHTVGINITCACEADVAYSPDNYYRHVAQVLDQHMQEREAEAWDECAKTFPEYDPLYDINPYK